MKEKLKELFVGKQPVRKRLLTAILPCLALSFTLMFFGPLDLSYISRSDLPYTAFDILPITLEYWAVTFLCLLIPVTLIGGKMHAFLVSFITGTTLACYIQGAFMNPDLGWLDGQTINWSRYANKASIGLAVWFVIIAVPFIVHYFSRPVWRKAVMGISALLFIMQGVSLTTKLIEQADYNRRHDNGYELMVGDKFTLGSEKNVIVFMLDSVSNEIFDEVCKTYPQYVKGLHDFTRFDNNNTRYMFTFPSVVSTLTDSEYECNHETSDEYFYRAWHSEKAETFYSTLHEQGYEVRFIVNVRDVFGFVSNVLEKVDNIEKVSTMFSANHDTYHNVIKLSFYRYMPLAMKSLFWIYTADLKEMKQWGDGIETTYGAHSFVRRFISDGIGIKDNERLFLFYQLNGAHHPWNMDSSMTFHDSLESVSRSEQAAGYFNLISLYLEQMKALGIYEDAMIIIMADHGSNTSANPDRQPFLLIRRPGDHAEEMRVTSAPTTIQDVFMGTVLESVTGDAGFGISAFDVPEEPIPERWTRTYYKDPSRASMGVQGFNSMIEYRYTGNGQVLNDCWKEKRFDEVIPLLENIY